MGGVEGDTARVGPVSEALAPSVDNTEDVRGLLGEAGVDDRFFEGGWEELREFSRGRLS